MPRPRGPIKGVKRPRGPSLPRFFLPFFFFCKIRFSFKVLKHRHPLLFPGLATLAIITCLNASICSLEIDLIGLSPGQPFRPAEGQEAPGADPAPLGVFLDAVTVGLLIFYKSAPNRGVNYITFPRACYRAGMPSGIRCLWPQPRGHHV